MTRPRRQPGTKGRSRKKGARLPALSEVLADARTVWQSVTVAGWYGSAERRLETCSGQAVWFRSGQTPLPIQWVLLRDPQNEFEPQALLCTDLARAPLCIIQWFVQRWPVEVTFREVRDHLGVESQRQWTDKAIARTTPCLLGLFSIVALLATRLSYHARIAGATAAWYRKSHPTFADTLAAVKSGALRVFQRPAKCQTCKNSRSSCGTALHTRFAWLPECRSNGQSQTEDCTRNHQALSVWSPAASVARLRAARPSL